MSQGDGQYNRQHDAREEAATAMRIRHEAEMRRRQERQQFLASLTPEQRAAIDAERQRALELGRRQARIYIQTTLNGRHVANVTSDEDDLDLERQRQQQNGGGRRRKKNSRKTKKTKKSRRIRKTRRHKTRKI
jgi:hypothetical protein